MNSICLNIGCGLSVGPSWINIDASPSMRLKSIPILGHLLAATGRIPNWSSHVVYGDVVRGLKVKPKSCELIFASHVLEHLSLKDFEIAIHNIHTYMKKDAIFRLIMPDLNQLVHEYLRDYNSDDEITAEKAALQFNEHSGLGLQISRGTVWQRFKEILGNSRHQWLWDKKSIQQKLINTGFGEINFCHYSEWTDKRFAEIENPERHQMSFCVECQRLN